MKIPADGLSTTAGETSAQPPVRPPRRPLTGWIFVLPIIFLVALLFQARQAPNPAVVSDLPVSPTPQLTAPPVVNATPEVGLGATPQANERLSSYTLYVPGPDAKLHKKIIQTNNDPTANPNPAQFEAWYNQQANRTLTLLFKEHNIFPAGTQQPKASLKNDVVNLNLNKSFGDSKLWKSETITTLAVYSLVNTLLSPGLKRDGKPKGVLLLIDNHPITNLGEFDASDPIEPNTQLVAGS